MMDESELKKLLQTFQKEYKKVVVEIQNKITDKDDYTDEFIEQNKLYAQIVLVQHILDSKSNAALAGKAKHN